MWPDLSDENVGTRLTVCPLGIASVGGVRQGLTVQKRYTPIPSLLWAPHFHRTCYNELTYSSTDQARGF